jgi:DNA (cytosine-5)-methyltransferase 1
MALQSSFLPYMEQLSDYVSLYYSIHSVLATFYCIFVQLNFIKYTISDRLWAGHKKRKQGHLDKGNGFGYSLVNENTPYTNTLSARYYKDGSEILVDQSTLGKKPRKLTPRECARVQGFPEGFIVDAVSHGQIYKQFGNSVCINVIEAVAKNLIKALEDGEQLLVTDQAIPA